MKLGRVRIKTTDNFVLSPTDFGLEHGGIVSLWRGKIDVFDGTSGILSRSFSVPAKFDADGHFVFAAGPTGTTLASVRDCSGDVYLWNLEDVDPAPKVFRGLRSMPTSCRLSRKNLLCGTDGSVKIWSIDEPGNPLTLVEFEDGSLETMEMSPNDEHVAIGSSYTQNGVSRSDIRVWNLSSRALVTSIDHPSRSNWVVSLGRGTLVIANGDAEVRRQMFLGYKARIEAYDTETWGLIQSFDLSGTVESLAISPDERFLVAGRRMTFNVYDLSAGSLMIESEVLYQTSTVKIGFNPNGNTFSVLRSAIVELWSMVGDTRALMKLLLDVDEIVRAQAAEEIGRRGDSRATPPLLKALEFHRELDAGSVSRVAVIEALGEVADERALRGLRDGLTHGGRLSAYYSAAISKIETRVLRESDELESLDALLEECKQPIPPRKPRSHHREPPPKPTPIELKISHARQQLYLLTLSSTGRMRERITRGLLPLQGYQELQQVRFAVGALADVAVHSEAPLADEIVESLLDWLRTEMFVSFKDPEVSQVVGSVLGALTEIAPAADPATKRRIGRGFTQVLRDRGMLGLLFQAQVRDLSAVLDPEFQKEIQSARGVDDDPMRSPRL